MRSDEFPEHPVPEPQSSFAWFRSVAYDMRVWTSEDPDATAADFAPLRLELVQALAAMAFLGLAGLTLVATSNDRFATAGMWLLALTPVIGAAIFLRSFGKDRRQ